MLGVSGVRLVISRSFSGLWSSKKEAVLSPIHAVLRLESTEHQLRANVQTSVPGLWISRHVVQVLVG